MRIYVYGVNDKTIKFDPILSVTAYMFIRSTQLSICLVVLMCYTHIIKNIDRVVHCVCISVRACVCVYVCMHVHTHVYVAMCELCVAILAVYMPNNTCTQC